MFSYQYVQITLFRPSRSYLHDHIYMSTTARSSVQQVLSLALWICSVWSLCLVAPFGSSIWSLRSDAPFGRSFCACRSPDSVEAMLKQTNKQQLRCGIRTSCKRHSKALTRTSDQGPCIHHSTSKPPDIHIVHTSTTTVQPPVLIPSSRLTD